MFPPPPPFCFGFVGVVSSSPPVGVSPPVPDATGCRVAGQEPWLPSAGSSFSVKVSAFSTVILYAQESRDADRGMVGLEDVIGIIGRTGREDGNVLATFADYGNKRLIFGSDPEGRGKSAYGTLYSLNWEEAFAR